MELTGQAIRSQTFGAKVGGYDPGEVDKFLESIAQQIDVLNTMPSGAPRDAERLRAGSEMRSVTFRSRTRGYSPGEVDALLEVVANSLSEGGGHFVPPAPIHQSGDSAMSPVAVAVLLGLAFAIVVFTLLG